MSVTIDPSQIRQSGAGVSRPNRLPWGKLLLAGGGGIGLVAFTLGAFSFFSGIADPRVRPARPMPATIATNLPDMRDGVPALAPETGASPSHVATATALNLPRPGLAAAPVAAATAPDLALRSEPPEPAAVPAAAPAEATGSVATRAADATSRTKPVLPIENATTVTADAKTVPLIAPARAAGPLAPAKAETVRAKTAAEPRPVAATAPEPAKPEKTPSLAAKRKTPAPAAAQARGAALKPVVEASAEKAPPRAADTDSDDPEVLGVKVWGGRQIREGLKWVVGDEN